MDKNPNNTRRPVLGQKIVLVILLFLGIGALTLGFLQFQRSLSAPFPQRTREATGENITSDLEEMLSMQNKDTDQDGLSDYDELYVFNTSPFLEDSDSDGFLDREEIESGNDPNCPKGKDCRGLAREKEGEKTGPSLILPESGFGEIDSGAGQEEMAVGALRERLRAAGIPEEILAQFDDATLLSLYQESLSQSLSGANTNTSSLPPEVGVDLENLSAEQIRELLRQAGVSEEILAQFDDETLKELLRESLKKE